jgi:hypothetical protein
MLHNRLPELQKKAAIAFLISSPSRLLIPIAYFTAPSVASETSRLDLDSIS